MAMEVLALSVLQADMNFVCAPGWGSVVFSKVPQLNWSAWTGVELKCALPSGNAVEWVCVCLNHVSTQYPYIEMFLRQLNPPEFASIITPTCSEKSVGNLIFTMLPLQMTLCLFIGQRITLFLMTPQKLPPQWCPVVGGVRRHSLHQTRQEGLLWDSDQNS